VSVDLKSEQLYESVVKAAAAAVAAQSANLFPTPNHTTSNKQSEPISLSLSHSTSSSAANSSASSIDEETDENDDYSESNHKQDLATNNAHSNTANGDDHSSGSASRPNRTKFSRVQIRALGQLFKQQRYPKDEQIAKLAKSLHLKQRVITVWFQNARQKARKSTTTTAGI
jgi:hypothetical protein